LCSLGFVVVAVNVEGGEVEVSGSEFGRGAEGGGRKVREGERLYCVVEGPCYGCVVES